MKAIYCDVCRKAIQGPVPTRNYWHIREYEVCDPCKEVIDSKLRPVVRAHFPYSKDWYEQQLMGLIKKSSSSGRA